MIGLECLRKPGSVKPHFQKCGKKSSAFFQAVLLAKSLEIRHEKMNCKWPCCIGHRFNMSDDGESDGGAVYDGAGKGGKGSHGRGKGRRYLGSVSDDSGDVAAPTTAWSANSAISRTWCDRLPPPPPAAAPAAPVVVPPPVVPVVPCIHTYTQAFHKPSNITYTQTNVMPCFTDSSTSAKSAGAL